MVNKSRTIIAHGVSSGLVLICGIVSPVLVWLISRQIFEMAPVQVNNKGFDESTYRYYFRKISYWYISVINILPGVLGIIASIIKRDRFFSFYLVIVTSIFSLMIILTSLGFAFVSPLLEHVYTDCTEAALTCVCSNAYRTSVNLGSSCAVINSLSTLGIGVVFVNITGLLGGLAACITISMLSCCTRHGEVVRHRQTGTGNPPTPRGPKIGQGSVAICVAGGERVKGTSNQHPCKSDIVQPGRGYRSEVMSSQYVELPGYQSARNPPDYTDNPPRYDELKF